MKPIVTRIDHVTLLVNDLERSIKFYTEKLGFEVRGETEHENIKTVFLKSGDACIDLYGLIEGKPIRREHQENEVGLVHIALKVDNFDEAYTELKRRGVEFFIEAFYQPRSGRRIAFFKDPDGNILHITDGKPATELTFSHKIEIKHPQ